MQQLTILDEMRRQLDSSTPVRVQHLQLQQYSRGSRHEYLIDGKEVSRGDYLHFMTYSVPVPREAKTDTARCLAELELLKQRLRRTEDDLDRLVAAISKKYPEAFA